MPQAPRMMMRRLEERFASWATRLLFVALFYAVRGLAQPETESVQPPPPVTQGEHTPQPIWQSVRLRVDVESSISGCPQQPELTSWVNELVGHAFIAEAAAIEVLIVVHRSESEALLVELFASDPSMPQQAVVLRRFERELPCSELLRAAALTISLFAKSPEDVRPEAVLAFPESEPERLNPPASTEGEPSTQALAPSTAGEPPVAAPETTRPTSGSATATESSEAAVQPGDINEPQEQVTAPPIVADATPSSVTVVVGAAGLGALGLNPGIGVGGALHLGVHVAQWDVLIRGAHVASTGQQLTPADGSIYGSTSELLLAACPIFTGQVALRLCGSAGPVWVYAKGRGFDTDRRALLSTLAVGGSAELLLALSPGLAFGAQLELLVPFAPVEYKILGRPDASWTMWSAVPRAAIGIEWR